MPETEQLDFPRGASEPGYGLLTPVPDLSAIVAAIGKPVAEHVFGADFYHLNFANDGPLPVGTILSDGRIGFIVLKFSQGVSYGDWAPHQAPAVRSSHAALGGYHMLDGSSGTGAQQADYFLNKYDPQPGDIEPIMDFEASGRGGASIGAYAAKAREFTAAIHAAGFGCTIYGHADVKAAWSDWRQSGADHWWVPGSSAHNDVGPAGPDIWQFGPYVAPAGYPIDPLHNGQRADMSVVMTALPIIGGGDDVRFDNWHTGFEHRLKQAGPPAADADADTKTGFVDADTIMDAVAAAAKTPAPGPASGVTKSAFTKHAQDGEAHHHHHTSGLPQA